MQNNLNQTMDNALVPDVKRAASGDREAFARLVAATTSTVCGIAYAILRDSHSSEDVAQDVYLSVWSGLGKLENPRSFMPWIRQITRNHANGWLRGKFSRHEPYRIDDSSLEQVADTREGPVESLEERENLRLAAEALESVPTESREVLVLYYREGKSSEQVADLLGLSEPAVRKRLSRARKQIRQDVADRVRRGIQRSAPGAAFVTTVLASMAVNTGTASAAVVGGSAIKGAVAGGAKLQLLPWLAGAIAAVPGIAGGVAGMLIWLREDMAEAMDDEELHQLRALRRTGIGGTIAAGLLLGASSIANHWLAPTAVYVGFVAFLTVLTQWAFPRVVARRLAHELEVDSSAAERHRRRRAISIVGLLVGALCGGVGLAMGLWMTGLLPIG